MLSCSPSFVIRSPAARRSSSELSGLLVLQRDQGTREFSSDATPHSAKSARKPSNEVVPDLVELEVAVPRLTLILR